MSQDFVPSPPPADVAVAAAVRAALDAKTKPRGSLGKLEALAIRYAASRGEARPEPPRKAIVVMAADHGVAAEGVSAYPPEVTRQMVLNFARGGAAVNVLARAANARLVVVDIGVREPVSAPGVLSRRMGPGTQSIANGAAMPLEAARAAIRAGVALADELTREGITLVGIGEMGIGNTTSASALTAAFTGTDVAAVVGRGTGVDEAGLARKREAVERALVTNAPDPSDALATLAKLGGFEIAGLVGVVLGCAARRTPVLLDGFIASVAGLVAARMEPVVTDHLIAAHRSPEPGHGHVLAALGLTPLLDLELRLGEGTGGALAMGLVDAAIAVLRDMATFAEAQVSDTGA